MAAPELSKLVSSAAEAARGAEAGDAAARDRALDSLRLLSRAAVTATLLKETDAGKRVNRLSKSTDEEVAAAASKVVLAWKDCVKRGVAAADGVTAAGALSRRGSEAALASQRSTGGAASSSSGLPGDDAAVGDSADASRPTVSAADAQQQQAPSGSRPSLPPVPTQAAAAAAAVPSKTGDARRDRIRQLLSDALALVPLDERGGADPGAVGAAVEDAVHAKYGGSGPDYSAKVRSLSFNLKDPANPDLRTRVLRGNVTPQVSAVLGGWGVRMHCVLTCVHVA